MLHHKQKKLRASRSLFWSDNPLLGLFRFVDRFDSLFLNQITDKRTKQFLLESILKIRGSRFLLCQLCSCEIQHHLRMGCIDGKQVYYHLLLQISNLRLHISIRKKREYFFSEALTV